MILQLETLAVLLLELIILQLDVVVKQVIYLSVGPAAPRALARDVSLEIGEEPRAEVNWRCVLRHFGLLAGGPRFRTTSLLLSRSSSPSAHDLGLARVDVRVLAVLSVLLQGP